MLNLKAILCRVQLCHYFPLPSGLCPLSRPNPGALCPLQAFLPSSYTLFWGCKNVNIMKCPAVPFNMSTVSLKA